jgi:ribonucleotide reductase alpha subunit
MQDWYLLQLTKEAVTSLTFEEFTQELMKLREELRRYEERDAVTQTTPPQNTSSF